MSARKVLLAGWDAADWKVIQPLMASGQMPNIQRLVENGAMGPAATLYPPLSPMLWTSIATGKRPFKHGIHGFSEPTPDGRGVQPVSNRSRSTKAIWNILNQNGGRSIVVGWWPSHPAEPIRGVMVSDRFHRAERPLEEGWPMPAGAVHPVGLAPMVADLRVHPDTLTPELIEPFIPLAREIDQEKDQRLGVCMRTVAEAMSIQAAACRLMEHEPWDLCAVYFDSIDHFCHGFMRYHPPRQAWVTARDFELYRNVVAEGYRLHDRMLGRLLDLAGGDTTVVLVSDHGFHPDHQRAAAIPDIPAGPAVEHRDLGILALCGPGIRAGEDVRGASILDIAPTILALFGLPAGEDMDGKVLSRVLAGTPLRAIPSWDAVAGDAGCHPDGMRADAVVSGDALAQLIALGYIAQPDGDRAVAVEKTLRELRYNLAESYQDCGRHGQARQILSELRAADPDELRFAVRLFVSCQALGMRGEMRRILDDLGERRPKLVAAARGRIEEVRAAARGRELTSDERREMARARNVARSWPAVTDYLKAQVMIAERRYAEALAALEAVAKVQPARPDVVVQIGDLYWRLGRAAEAERVYRKALEIDPDHAPADLGLARVALRRRDFDAAARAALDAVERGYQNPVGHFLLGRALAGMGEYKRSAEAFRAALSLNPNFPEAHYRLAALLEKHLGDTAPAAEHRRLALEMRRSARGVSRAGAAAALRKIGEILPMSTDRMPPLDECLVIVTGLPRSGTSMLMQMLAAGGIPILSDGQRTADEDNPRGYLEFEPVKGLLRDAQCLLAGRGKAVKIVVPLQAALPDGLPCRAILVERDIDEVLDSQELMLERSGKPVERNPAHRKLLRDEFGRLLSQAKQTLAARADTQLLVIGHAAAIADPTGTAARVNAFLGGGFDASAMATAIDPALHRNRALVSKD